MTGRIFISLFAACLLAASPLAAATIPVANFSFEQGPSGNQPGQTNGLRFDQLNSTNPGWDTYSSLSGWTKSGGGRIEIQSDNSAALNAQDGDYFISLDGGPGRNTSISQDLVLGVGSYILSFWYSPESSNAATNAVAYNLGNVVSGVVTAGTNGAAVGGWTEIRTRIGILTPGSYSLRFAANGAADGVGGFVDNVTFAAAIPVPAAGFAALSGLAALLGLKRRRKAA